VISMAAGPPIRRLPSPRPPWQQVRSTLPRSPQTATEGTCAASRPLAPHPHTADPAHYATARRSALGHRRHLRCCGREDRRRMEGAAARPPSSRPPPWHNGRDQRWRRRELNGCWVWRNSNSRPHRNKNGVPMRRIVFMKEAGLQITARVETMAMSVEKSPEDRQVTICSGRSRC
jgi:hypothetical protein